jgi:hypothetical protein
MSSGRRPVSGAIRRTAVLAGLSRISNGINPPSIEKDYGDRSSLIVEAVRFPQAIVFTFFLCSETGGIAFLDLNIPDDVLFGAADSCVDTPLPGYIPDLRHLHFPSPLF